MRITATLLAAAFLFNAGAWSPSARAQDPRKPLRDCQSITQSGSYVLEDNLSSSGGCLILQTSFITIDLNGFVIDGGGPGVGIGSEIERAHITVRNGGINNFQVGILLGDSARVEGVRASGNATAIEVGDGSTVTGNVATANGHAIVVGSSSTVAGNTVSLSFAAGINAGTFSTVSGNTASENASEGAEVDGIVVGEGSVVSGNTASSNGRDGIVVGQGSTVSGNAASRNGRIGILVGGPPEFRNLRSANSTVSGNTAWRNGNNGMVVGRGSTVSGNTASQNGFHGLDVHCPANIIGNTASGNAQEEISRGCVGRNCLRGCQLRSNTARAF